MDDHTDDENQHDIAVLQQEVRNNGAIPSSTYLVDHILRRLPCFAVGCGGVEVAAGAEEQPRKGDKREGLNHSPGATEPLRYLFLACQPP